MIFVSWWLCVWQRCSKGFSGAFRRAGGRAGSAADTEVSYVNIHGKKKHAGRWKWRSYCLQRWEFAWEQILQSGDAKSGPNVHFMSQKMNIIPPSLILFSENTLQPSLTFSHGVGVRYTQCGCLHERGSLADGQEQLSWSLELTWGARGLMHSLRLELSPRLKAGKGETSESGGGGGGEKEHPFAFLIHQSVTIPGC